MSRSISIEKFLTEGNEMIRRIGSMALLATAFLAPRAAIAQQDTRIGVAVETALPAHQLSQAFNSALGVELFGERQVGESPFSARLGLGYRSFFGETTWHLRVTDLEATGQYSARRLPLSPFVLAGVGGYSTFEKATVPGGVNGVAHGIISKRTESLGEVLGAGINIPIASFRIPLTYKYHRIEGLRVQNGPVAFSTWSVAFSF